MNTRRFLLPLMFALCAISGCAQPVEPPVAEGSAPDEKPRAGELPQAPPPHVKKTTAELLVGTWKTVERRGRPVPEGVTLAWEFTADGKFYIFVIGHPRPAPSQSPTIGTYKLDGNTIHLERPETADKPARKWDITIDSISQDTLILSGGGEDEPETCRRLPPK